MCLSLVSMGWDTLLYLMMISLACYGAQINFNSIKFFLLFTGRKKSLRSLEIPLENLLSGIIFLSGTLRANSCTSL